jgi:hypothetical protein
MKRSVVTPVRHAVPCGGLPGESRLHYRPSRVLVLLLLMALMLFLTSPIAFAQWVPQTLASGGIVLGLGMEDSTLYAGTFVNLTQGGLYRSSDYGDSWISIDSGLTNKKVFSLAVKDHHLFVGTDSGGMFLSTDRGSSWATLSGFFEYETVSSLVADDAHLYAATHGRLLVSEDNGSAWNPIALPVLGGAITSLAVRDSLLVLGTWGNGVLVSTNRGRDWSGDTLKPDRFITAVGIGERGIVAGTVNEVLFESVNQGRDWKGIGGGGGTYHSSSGIAAYVIVSVGSTLVVGAGQGVVVGTYKDSSWTFTNTGCSNVHSLAFGGPYLFAGGSLGDFWRRPLEEIVSSVKMPPAESPSRFRLEQNYPNPFNPVTKITFELPSNGPAVLKIFDLVGREIQTLFDGFFSAGTYTVAFDGSHLSTGVYVYRLTACGKSAARSMLFVK